MQSPRTELDSPQTEHESPQTGSPSPQTVSDWAESFESLSLPFGNRWFSTNISGLYIADTDEPSTSEVPIQFPQPHEPLPDYITYSKHQSKIALYGELSWESLTFCFELGQTLCESLAITIEEVCPNADPDVAKYRDMVIDIKNRLRGIQIELLQDVIRLNNDAEVPQERMDALRNPLAQPESRDSASKPGLYTILASVGRDLKSHGIDAKQIHAILDLNKDRPIFDERLRRLSQNLQDEIERYITP